MMLDWCNSDVPIRVSQRTWCHTYSASSTERMERKNTKASSIAVGAGCAKRHQTPSLVTATYWQAGVLALSRRATVAEDVASSGRMNTDGEPCCLRYTEKIRTQAHTNTSSSQVACNASSCSHQARFGTAADRCRGHFVNNK